MVLLVAAIGVAIIAAVVIREGIRNARMNDVHVASCLSNLDRLRAVAESGLMDTPRRAELDALTAEAAERLGAPMALISVLDDRRIFFASSFGLAPALAARRQQPAQHSYCKYVVAREAPLEVDDATRHSLVKGHQATIDGTRAYLGVPIRSASGHTIGAFCVVDTTTRRWSSDDRRLLEGLAERALSASPSPPAA